MVEAYLFFYEQLEQFFIGTGTDKPLSANAPLSQRLEECFKALKNALQVVAIDLDQDDDAQIIFETLNARGEPLLPSDLLRNFIFLQAERRGEPQEALYNKYWRRFDDPFWRVEIKQGRLFRPRSDLFMQHFLASRKMSDIPITHLFGEYKLWIEKEKPFSSVEEELATFSRQGDDFRRIIEPKKGDPLYALSTFLDSFDIRTSYPLLLTLLDMKIDEVQWQTISTMLESYLLRRAVCGLSTKGYNRIFLMLTRNLLRDGFTPEYLAKQLANLEGESAQWPSDIIFGEDWRTKHAYQILNNPKTVHILKRLNNMYSGHKTEVIPVDSVLTVEHILPQNWIDHWPLPNGEKGMSRAELWTADENDPRAVATRK